MSHRPASSRSTRTRPPSGCKTGPVDKMHAGWMKDGEWRKAKACAKADLE